MYIILSAFHVGFSFFRFLRPNFTPLLCICGDVAGKLLNGKRISFAEKKKNIGAIKHANSECEQMDWHTMLK